MTGCLSTEQTRVTNSSATAAAAKVTVRLPEQPTECRDHLTRVVPQVGEKARWTQQRWEVVADNRDALTDRCAEFYDDVKQGLTK